MLVDCPEGNKEIVNESYSNPIDRFGCGDNAYFPAIGGIQHGDKFLPDGFYDAWRFGHFDWHLWVGYCFNPKLYWTENMNWHCSRPWVTDKARFSELYFQKTSSFFHSGC
jgi:hypothetical protein